MAIRFVTPLVPLDGTRKVTEHIPCLNVDDGIDDGLILSSISNIIFLRLHGKFTIYPALWNPEHVKQWLEWAVKEYSLHEVDAARFNVIGRELCQLTRDDFSRLTNPYNGEVLYAHLNFLRQSESLPPSSSKHLCSIHVNLSSLFCLVL
ncbi:friend leukemia integration 1 transcription factor [Caerostris darwini]|uniref:Friend leukemia integration 1 transcription factor n=1 Tax=Caerostris darwini TaxID=1538125 RepID=A0AAV4USN0_9ARAC|nr:friend leukemia integration 1 transcription factor [Caerostris darwini]